MGASEFGRVEHAMIGFLYLTFALVGLVTNGLSLLALLREKSLFSGAARPWLHICLAIANIFVVAPSPFPASSSFSGQWLYGDAVCTLYAFEGMFVGLAAIGFVLALCMERYLVSSRTEAMTANPSGYYWTATITVLTNAFFWGIMPVLGWSRYTVDPAGTSCAIDWAGGGQGYNAYMMMLTGLGFVIPLSMALFSLLFSAGPRPAQGEASTSVDRQKKAEGGLGEETLNGLCASFLMFTVIGWGPFAALCTWAMFGDTSTVSSLAASIPPLACKAMTAAYPLAYAVASPRYRQAFTSFFSSAPAKAE